MSKTSDIDISAEEFNEKLKSKPGKIIDVRTRVEYDEGHLMITDEQYDWNSGEFHKVVDQMEKDKTYYLYCRSGNRSGLAARMMRKKGFENVYNVGGFEDLAEYGFEADRD